MSFEILRQVLDLENLPGVEKAVLIVLANRANDSGRCWPSMGDLARKSGFSRRHCMRAIQALEVKSLIAVERGGGLVSKYVVTGDRVSPYTISRTSQYTTR